MDLLKLLLASRVGLGALLLLGVRLGPICGLSLGALLLLHLLKLLLALCIDRSLGALLLLLSLLKLLLASRVDLCALLLLSIRLGSICSLGLGALLLLELQLLALGVGLEALLVSPAVGARLLSLQRSLIAPPFLALSTSQVSLSALLVTHLVGRLGLAIRRNLGCDLSLGGSVIYSAGLELLPILKRRPQVPLSLERAALTLARRWRGRDLRHDLGGVSLALGALLPPGAQLLDLTMLVAFIVHAPPLAIALLFGGPLLLRPKHCVTPRTPIRSIG